MLAACWRRAISLSPRLTDANRLRAALSNMAGSPSASKTTCIAVANLRSSLSMSRKIRDARAARHPWSTGQYRTPAIVVGASRKICGMQIPPNIQGYNAARQRSRVMPGAKRPPGMKLDPTFIKEWRKFKGLTQGEVGKRMGLNKSSISLMERAKTPYDQWRFGNNCEKSLTSQFTIFCSPTQARRAASGRSNVEQRIGSGRRVIGARRVRCGELEVERRQGRG